MKVAICPAVVNIPNSLVFGSNRTRAPSRRRWHSKTPSRIGSIIKASASLPYSSAVAVPNSCPCLTKCLSRSLRFLNGTGLATFQIVHHARIRLRSSSIPLSQRWGVRKSGRVLQDRPKRPVMRYSSLESLTGSESTVQLVSAIFRSGGGYLTIAFDEDQIFIERTDLAARRWRSPIHGRKRNTTQRSHRIRPNITGRIPLYPDTAVALVTGWPLGQYRSKVALKISRSLESRVRNARPIVLSELSGKRKTAS
jgi:hypothetical protein